MPAGRPPKPTAQKRLEGTLRPDRETPNALAFDPLRDALKPPSDLKSKVARQCWQVVTKELQQKKLLSTVDLALLRAYCYQVSLMIEAEKELETNGKTITMINKSGGKYAVKSPWIAILSDATEKVSKIGQQFGFSPSSRTRIAVPEKETEKKSGFAAFKK